jgi:peptidoglycan/LPS O-acetylase OafA/YrhL
MYVWLLALVVSSLPGSPSILKSMALLPHGLYFVGGSICYIVRARGLNWTRGAALLVCVAGSIYHAVQGRIDFTVAPQLASPIGVALAIVLFYSMLFAVATRVVRLPDQNVLYWLGALTYPLYLLHNRIGKIIFASMENAPDWARLGITMLAAYALAWVCARLIEPRVRGVVAAAIYSVLALRPLTRATARPDSTG